jgi:hypothetical protein
MRGDIVHRVYGVHDGRQEFPCFGTYRTVAEAEAGIVQLRERYGPKGKVQHYNGGFVIRPAPVESDFEVPPLRKPREKYLAVGTDNDRGPGVWNSTVVRISRRGTAPGELIPVCEFERNYALLSTFEPFRIGGRDFALVSRRYTKTAVVDLASGQFVAEETETNPGFGFCPVGFYVPDWWDLHDGSIIPGSPSWDADYEWPVAPFGFVWGCIWGDDSSWKVQYLDLSRVAEGVIKREERFGYVELATSDYLPPCLDPTWKPSAKPSEPPPFISVERYQGKTKVTFAVEMEFDFDGGACSQWKRTETPLD